MKPSFLSLIFILAAFGLGLRAEPGKPGGAFQSDGTKWQWCHLVKETLKPHCHDQPTEPAMKCCQVCVWTKACGDDCVDILRPCAKAKGCACNTLELPRVPASQVPKAACCVTCWQGKPCGDKCIPKGKLCPSPVGCACAPGQDQTQPKK